MGGCGSKDNTTLERPGQGILTFWGDPFSPETRTVQALLALGQIKHEFHSVDAFKGEHKQEAYTKINPLGSLPYMTEGRFVILGGQ